ncbi:GPI mannosyltransferase 4 [Wickerhamiella sorbophila]|uniref:Mannosyltransferase n=1 Tax=Wickerhamiella sorbophila TaxID=45607 RepID=A0A2T0FJT6_9ASCO|nr:GPI mannosyltransferase 4 [Wickerhamiella sorbophila]PRT55237.1 GPI mannosyltransferase 4 [Wickerhamiella sorbophila]
MPRLTFQSRRIWRGIFTVSFILRAYLTFQNSYLHPDEHVQGPEVIANGYFGWAAQFPWEFTSDNPIRSMVPLWMVYGIPMSFFSGSTSPLHVLYAIRIILTLLTWVLTDMAVDRLSKFDTDKLRSLIFVSTSYVTMTYQAHTLSNGLETILLLWCLVIIHEFKVTNTNTLDRQYDSLLLGFLLALGVFNRPTFLGFLVLPSIQLFNFFIRHPGSLLTCVFAGVASSMLFIYIDTLLYAHDDWVIAPLNNVRYNLLSTNLSMHGLHPRYFHLLVNLPALIGPGILLIEPGTSLSMLSAVSGLVSLSLFPHQEARFLIPLIPLLCMNMDFRRFSARFQKILLVLWLAFNLVMSFILGVYHQGGVIPAQTELRKYPLPSTVIWWKTYVPPLWLTGLQHDEVKYVSVEKSGVESVSTALEPANKSMVVIDVQGLSQDVFDDVLSRTSGTTYVVAPLGSKVEKGELIWKHNQHISFDNGGLFSSMRGLGIWEVKKSILSRIL